MWCIRAAPVLLLLLAGPALGQIKISAIGASTTQGSGAPAGQSYPDQLQKLLGSQYQVRNFGKSGAGALRAGNPTYWNSAEQKAAAAFAPDIVINWLGGADSKAASWDGHKAEFLGDYKAMIKYYQDLPSRPKIISMMSIALHDDAGVRKTVLEAEVNPLQRQGALEMGSRFIDTKSIVDGHPEYFNDGVHLKAIGYAAIAKAVEAEVRALAATADAGATTDGSTSDATSATNDAGGGSPPLADAATPGTTDAATVTPNPTPVPTVDAATTTEPPGSRRDAAATPPTTGNGSTGKSGSSGCVMGATAPTAAGPSSLALLSLAVIGLRLGVRSGRGRLRRIGPLLIAVLMLLAPGPGWADGDPRQGQRADLVKKFVDLSQQASFTPASAAAALGARLGAAQHSTSVRTDFALGATNQIASGEVSTAKRWIVVEVKPSPALSLTLQDVLPALLDLPHVVEVQTGHDQNGPVVIGKNHLFRVKGGMLVVSVPAGRPAGGYKAQLEKAYGQEWDAAAGKPAPPQLVQRLLLTNEPRPGLEKAPSLRAFREQARKAPDSK